MRTTIQKIRWAVGLVMLTSMSLVAVDVTLPHTFTAGETAKASEVNENFNTLLNNIVGIDYVAGGYLSSTVLNSLGIRNQDPNTLLRTLTIEAPMDGYAVVTVAGKGCVHTDNEFIELMLSTDGVNYINGANIYSVLGAGTACGIDVHNATFSFRYIEPVVKGDSYTYSLLGHRGSNNTISANIDIGDMMVAVYPKL